MNKKAMEISINVIVGIIIGLIMLSTGIVIFKQIVEKNQELLPIVEQEMERQMLEAFVDPNELLFIPTTDKTIQSGKTAEFPFGIRNIYSEKKYFEIEVTNAGPEPAPATAFFEGPHEIDAADKEILLLLVGTEDLPRGTYSLLIRIKSCNDQVCASVIDPEYAKRIVRVNVR